MAAMPVISFQMSGLPPSQNKRLHHMQRYRDNQEWKDWTYQAALAAVNESKVTGLPWGRVHLLYTFHYPRVTMADPDNLIGSTKPCTDGMKGLLFPDDSVRYIHELSVRVEVIPKTSPGFRVDISECECERMDPQS